jgi:hypothetical protein
MTSDENWVYLLAYSIETGSQMGWSGCEKELQIVLWPVHIVDRILRLIGGAPHPVVLLVTDGGQPSHGLGRLLYGYFIRRFNTSLLYHGPKLVCPSACN